MSARNLDAFINERHVGTLREENDLWVFDYAPAWASAADAFDLSPVLPRSTLSHRDGASERPVQWYFDNLLPEEALRTVLAKEARVPEEDSFGLLQFYGAESAGSLVLRDPEHPVVPEKGQKLLPDAELAQRIQDLPRLPLNHGSPKHMSLAGAQHKLAVVYRDGQIYEPLPGDVSTHILKPNHQSGDYPSSVMNEYFVMRLAGRVGLVVPEVFRHYCPEPVYLVTRFDREDVEGEPLRRHIIDTCQLLNKSRTFKYRAATVESLRAVMKYVRTKSVARQMLYRWLMFNVIVGNGDNHLKNISYMVSPDGIEISPCYDLLSTAVYTTRAFAHERAAWPRVEIALPLPDAPTFSDVTRTAMLEAGRRLGLGDAVATRELDQMLKRITLEASALYQEVEAENAQLDGPARLSVAGDMRVLRTILHLVIPEMVAKLA